MYLLRIYRALEIQIHIKNNFNMFTCWRTIGLKKRAKENESPLPSRYQFTTSFRFSYDLIIF